MDIEAEEAALVRFAEAETQGLRPLPGARAFLGSLPQDRWAIVTAAARSIAHPWLDHNELPSHPAIVAAGDVPDGKPRPGPSLKAAELSEIRAADVVVFEDATSGLVSVRAAGTTVIAVAGDAALR